MIFNLFKKKEKPITFHSIVVRKKSNKKVYVGQIVSIDADVGKNDNEVYYLNSYLDGQITNKISTKEIEYCQKYKYAIIKNIDEELIEALVICCDGYLKRLKVSLDKEYENGTSFMINGYDLYDNNKIVGKITDKRYDPNEKIELNELESDRIIAFIRK